MNPTDNNSNGPGGPTFTEEQIRDILQQAGGGVKVVDLAARYRVPEILIRGWLSRYQSSQRTLRDSMAREPKRGPIASADTTAILENLPPPLAAALAAANAKAVQLEEENARLRRIVGDLVIENHVLKEGMAGGA